MLKQLQTCVTVCHLLMLLKWAQAQKSEFNISSEIDKNELWNAPLRQQLPLKVLSRDDDSGDNFTKKGELLSDAHNDIITNSEFLDPNSIEIDKNGDDKSELNFSEHENLNRNENTLDEVKDIFSNSTTNINVKRTNDKETGSSVLKMLIENLEAVDVVSNYKRNANFKAIKMQRPKSEQTSLVFVFDGTGSMTSSLEQLRDGAKSILNKFAEQADDDPFYNYIFVPFRDPDVGPELVTTERKKLLEALNQIILDGGGDCPEYMLNGILLALKYALPKSIVYIFSDASASDYAYEQKVIQEIERKQATLNFLLTGNCNSESSPKYTVIKRLAAVSNGQVYDLKSGINGTRDVLNNIEASMDLRRSMVASFYSPNFESKPFNLTVDKNMQDINVIVAGIRPNVTIIGPNNKTPDNITETLNLDNVKIVNVKEPQPGTYGIKTTAYSGHSVRVTAVSNATFEFGFSVAPPNDISDTSFYPLMGLKNILSIKVSDASVNLTRVQLEKVVSEHDDFNSANSTEIYPLRLQSAKVNNSEETESLYTTLPIQPPEGRFKIIIHGFDGDKNPIQRLLSTEIQSKPDQAPQVFIAQPEITVSEAEELEIICRILSLTPVTIDLKHGNRTLKQLHSEQTTNFEHKIDYSELTDAGTYVCFAKNDQGTAEQQVHVTILNRPLSVFIPQPKYIHIENQTQVTIPCVVLPKSIIQLKWYFNSSEIDADDSNYKIESTNLIIRKLSKEHTGLYTCKAITPMDQKAASTHLTVLFSPRLLEPLYEEINMKYNNMLNISCSADGMPPVKSEWTFQSFFNGHLQTTSPSELFPISNFENQHEGTYECIAANGVGDPVKRKVKVRGLANKAPKIERTDQDYVEISAGDDLALNCYCEMCEPILELSWTHQESINRVNKISKLNTNTWKNRIDYSLNLLNVTEKDAGLYTCHIKNEHGQDEYIIAVNVRNPPNIEHLQRNNSNGNSSERSTEEASPFIKCILNGNTHSIIKSFKNSTEVIFDEKQDIDENLNLSNRIIFDTGVYSCEVMNPLGSVVHNFSMIVAAPQGLNQSDTELYIADVTEGFDVNFEKCVLNKLKSPALTHLLNGKELNAANSSKYPNDGLKLEFQPNFRVSEIYECQILVANTTVASEQFVLAVFVKPQKHPKNNEIISIKSNGEAILSCDALRYPLPNISWHLEDDDSIKGDSNENNTIDLMNKNVSKFEQGAYVCDAFNNFDITQKTFYFIVNDPPIIESQFPPNMTLLRGQQVTIICSAAGSPPPKTYWIKDDYIVAFNSNLQLYTTAADINSGLYTCISENTIGIDLKSIYVHIVDKPNHLSNLTDAASVAHVLHGEILKLTCPFENYKSLTWFKNGQALNNNAENEVHHLKNIVPTDRGNYTCRVENEAGQNEYTHEVFVHYPPTIISNNKYEPNFDKRKSNISHPDLEVVQGENLKFKCMADGYPKPKIRWLRDGEIVSKNETLFIKEVDVIHHGAYVCNANNAHGSDSKHYDLNVLYSPVHDWDADNFAEVNLNDSILLNCSMEANPMPIYSWFKDNNQIADANQSFLAIAQSRISDNGTYACYAKNRLGNSTLQFHVHVYMAPKIKYITSNATVQQFDNLNMTCTAIGYPLPTVSWLYKNRVILSTSKINVIQEPKISGESIYYIDSSGIGNSFAWLNFPAHNSNKSQHIVRYGDNNTVSLELNYNRKADKNSGKFTCIAINAVGNDKQTTSIQIVSPPTFRNSKGSNDVSKVDVLEGFEVVLNCDAIGQPLPEIAWQRDIMITDAVSSDSKNFKLSTNGKHLSILQATTEHAGRYECIARNLAGVNRLYFDVNVLVPPNIKQPDDAILFHTNDDDLSKILTIPEGSSIKLQCPVYGNPKPIISWTQINYRDGDAIKRDFIETVNSTLEIDALTYSTMFVCHANSSLGDVEYAYHVIVEKPPTFLDGQNDKNQTIDLHLGFTLNCSVSGEPEPIVQWYKDEELIGNASDYGKIGKNTFFSTNGKLLRVISSTMGHSGRYECLADNHSGSIKRHFFIQIKDRVQWSPWQPWSTCSASCGIGKRTRHRICIHRNGTLANDSYAKCNGHDEEIQDCEMMPCPVNGEWSDWDEWSACSLPCIPVGTEIESKRIRYRQCNAPVPSFGGKPCLGSDFQFETCRVSFCAVNGGWSEWTAWSACSKSCNGGSKFRKRYCNNPAPQNNGANCMGIDTESIRCAIKACPTNGGWSSWSPWSSCSRTCDKGQQYKFRECNKPKPRNGGRDCVGSNLEIIDCELRPCQNVYKPRSNIGTPFIMLLEARRPDSYSNTNRFDESNFDVETDYDKIEENRSFFEGRPEEIVQFSNNHYASNEKNYDNVLEDEKEKVTVRVANYIPLSSNLAQVSLNLRHNGLP